jgi:two-component system, sensor histidine kinase and response regulator
VPARALSPLRLQQSSSATGDAQPPRSLRILLAEDNAVNQRVATGILRNLGHEVELAGNGAEAIEKVKASSYDLVLMDMQMPELDGLEATLMIRQLSGPAALVPIVAMTANAFATDREACLGAGMNDFISKPVSRDKLSAVLQLWAGGTAPGTTKPSLAAAAAKHIDYAHFEALAHELGEDGRRDLLVSFWGDLPETFRSLQGAFERQDVKAADRALHTLKGAAANLGLIACQAACETIRNDLAAHGVDALQEGLPMLLQICRESERLSRELIRAGKPKQRAARTA